MQNGRLLLCSNLVSFDYESHVTTSYCLIPTRCLQSDPQTVNNISQHLYLELIARCLPHWRLNIAAPYLILLVSQGEWIWRVTLVLLVWPTIYLCASKRKAIAAGPQLGRHKVHNIRTKILWDRKLYEPIITIFFLFCGLLSIIWSATQDR
jgi:hypothetical protein